MSIMGIDNLAFNRCLSPPIINMALELGKFHEDICENRLKTVWKPFEFQFYLDFGYDLGCG